MAKIFELAGIDYGRADFGIVDNRIVLYEINTNPNTQPPDEIHPNATRQENINLSWGKYCAALHQIDSLATGKKLKAPSSVPGLKRPRPSLFFFRIFRPWRWGITEAAKATGVIRNPTNLLHYGLSFFILAFARKSPFRWVCFFEPGESFLFSSHIGLNLWFVVGILLLERRVVIGFYFKRSGLIWA